MAKNLLFFIIISVALPAVLTACSGEPVYRGVPNTEWQQLSAEQKQLIVDRSFQDEMK